MIPSLSFTGVKLLEAKGPFSSSNPVHQASSRLRVVVFLVIHYR
jgi:hypothetical protein